jgi:serine protease inhibitor
MPLMTRPEADFSGLFERHGDGRDAAAGGCGVVHGAALEFRRHDCEGQSFVLSSLLGAAPDHISLKVNRPFLFVVRDNRTGALVLVGRVSQPD